MKKASNGSDERGADGSTPVRLATARLFRWISFAFLGLCTLTAQAAGEWIDEFPNVTDVARAVSDQIKTGTVNWNFGRRGIALMDDDDLFSVYMVGTLVMMRRLVLYKYEQEQKSLSPQDVEKLRFLVASYLEAELVIGKGIGSRRGYLTTERKCRDMDCYKIVFKSHYLLVDFPDYRDRILPRLFCDDVLATELIKLALSKDRERKAPSMPSPAMTLQVESSVAGLAPAGCSIYGGDKDKNGLCDDWQPPKVSSATSSNTASCLPINRDNQPVFSGGVRVASNRWVEVKTGVNGRQEGKCAKVEKQVKDCDGNVGTYEVPSGGGCGINNGISIRVKCATGHVVQFISREYRLRGKADTNEVPGNLEGGHYATGPYTDPDKSGVLVATCHPKTTSVRNRSWRTDSQVKSNPYYESGGSYTRSSRCMTTLDAPTASFDPQKYLAVRIVGKSFAVCGCKVVSVVDWERTYYAGNPKVPVYEVKPPRDPNPGEVEQFQAEAKDERFAAWPSADCNQCQQ